jgi:hypothetical protein
LVIAGVGEDHRCSIFQGVDGRREGHGEGGLPITVAPEKRSGAETQVDDSNVRPAVEDPVESGDHLSARRESILPIQHLHGHDLRLRRDPSGSHTAVSGYDSGYMSAVAMIVDGRPGPALIGRTVGTAPGSVRVGAEALLIQQAVAEIRVSPLDPGIQNRYRNSQTGEAHRLDQVGTD